jgi:predicted Fe-S protein YdhL (DUF1289 family)
MADPSDPPSPCNQVCRVDPHSGQCEGCRRTLAEIAGWPSFTPAQKRAVLAELPGRAPPQR